MPLSGSATSCGRASPPSRSSGCRRRRDDVSAQEPKRASSSSMRPQPSSRRWASRSSRDVDKSGFQKIADPYLDKLAKELGPHAEKIKNLIRGDQLTLNELRLPGRSRSMLAAVSPGDPTSFLQPHTSRRGGRDRPAMTQSRDDGDVDGDRRQTGVAAAASSEMAGARPARTGPDDAVRRPVLRLLAVGDRRHRRRAPSAIPGCGCRRSPRRCSSTRSSSAPRSPPAATIISI